MKKVAFPVEQHLLQECHTCSIPGWNYQQDDISTLWYTKEEFQANLSRLHQAAKEMEDQSSSTSSVGDGDRATTTTFDMDTSSRTSSCSSRSSSSSISSRSSCSLSDTMFDDDAMMDICLVEQEIDKRCIERLITNVSSVRQPIQSVLDEQTRLREGGVVDPIRLASAIENVSQHRHRIAHLVALRDAQEVSSIWSQENDTRHDNHLHRRSSVPVAPQDLVSISTASYATPTSKNRKKSKSPMRQQRRRDRISRRSYGSNLASGELLMSTSPEQQQQQSN